MTNHKTSGEFFSAPADMVDITIVRKATESDIRTHLKLTGIPEKDVEEFIKEYSDSYYLVESNCGKAIIHPDFIFWYYARVAD